MRTVNMHEAKTNLSRLVEEVEKGVEIAIARNGRVVARLVPAIQQPIDKRLGVARGLFTLPDDIDADNPEIERMFS